MPALPADAATVLPAARVSGRIRLPGDKSISHRYAMLAALAEGVSTIHGYSPGADCAATLACLAGLGARVERRGSDVTIEGRGPGGLRAPAYPLDAGNSGTTMRLLAGILAAHPFTSVLTGDSSLSNRPMRRVIAPLTEMGARIESRDGRPPLTVRGTPLHGITCEPEVASAQVKSAVLLAGLHASRFTTVVERTATRDHTERALRLFGAEVDRIGQAITVRGGQRLSAVEAIVPGDLSGATFWMVLAAATPGGAIDVEEVGLNPTRTAVLDVLRRAGADVEASVDRPGCEPAGRVHVAHRRLRSFALPPDEVPGVIDEIPALAALAALMPAGESMRVDGAAELRVKESDRIACLARGFRALGCEVDEFDDGFELHARPLRGAPVNAEGDHRLAMAFAIAATRAAGPTTIAGAASVAVSYPEFFDELARLTGSGGGR